jgi:hypothetical protein
MAHLSDGGSVCQSRGHQEPASVRAMANPGARSRIDDLARQIHAGFTDPPSAGPRLCPKDQPQRPPALSTGKAARNHSTTTFARLMLRTQSGLTDPPSMRAPSAGPRLCPKDQPQRPPALSTGKAARNRSTTTFSRLMLRTQSRSESSRPRRGIIAPSGRPENIFSFLCLQGWEIPLTPSPSSRKLPLLIVHRKPCSD